jgi:hypothetical protein
VEKYDTARQATDGNIIQPMLGMLDIKATDTHQ